MPKSQKTIIGLIVGSVIVLAVFFVTMVMGYRIYRQQYPEYVNGAMACGGMLAIECSDGYMCYRAATQTSWEKGTCIPEYVDPPQESMTCGGVAGFECPAGYACEYLDDAPIDALGTCVPANILETNTNTQPEQQLCGGSENIQCPTDFFCQRPADAPTDVTGVCILLEE